MTAGGLAPVVAVRGQAAFEVEPELARLAVTTSARDDDRAKVLRLLNERAGLVDTILRGFGEAIEKVETSGVRVSPQFKSARPKERIAGYVAVVQRMVTVVNFERLGELVAQLADQDLTEVAGPWWALRPDSEVHRRARLDAVRDAVQRARDYASAVGGEIVELVELADAGLLAGVDQGHFDQPAFAARAQMARGGGMAPEELTFDISPVKQHVWAHVDARFHMSAPTLAAVT